MALLSTRPTVRDKDTVEILDLGFDAFFNSDVLIRQKLMSKRKTGDATLSTVVLIEL